ncbi:hypothetical protein CORC01_04807 [Colletotrichum orchidophilum]|uniref:LITAF domain-containing protein n=1 Tax=Colletotrichum orchidophilum TaxID=1209926 RepID=A0A1G4BEY2_9PEZI|nr:uncharacterized protein CORC01_04807 [Colletotrichum orchidophilum]OHE99906.1 hypothetical protein CORC01_04807 [Colletotrichum orchidophilum]
MGPLKTAPSEAAPAYDEHGFHDEHPVNAFPPSGSASAYATVPQSDERDIELAHNHDAPDSSAPFKPHQHCETCDKFTSAREVRANERHCCLWVSIVFMTISLSALVLGIVAIEARFKHHKD